MNHLTAKAFLTRVGGIINNTLTNIAVPEAALIESLNSALSFIYMAHTWNRARFVETKDVVDISNYTLKYLPQEILELSINGSPLKQVTYEPQQGEFIISGKVIDLGAPVTGELKIIYRRYNTIYNASNLDTLLDIPSYLNEAALNHVLLLFLPVFLGEGAGKLVGFYQAQRDQLLHNAIKMDSGLNGEKQLYTAEAPYGWQ